jgi:hypothetical protein
VDSTRTLLLLLPQAKAKSPQIPTKKSYASQQTRLGLEEPDLDAKLLRLRLLLRLPPV